MPKRCHLLSILHLANQFRCYQTNQIQPVKDRLSGINDSQGIVIVWLIHLLYGVDSYGVIESRACRAACKVFCRLDRTRIASALYLDKTQHLSFQSLKLRRFSLSQRRWQKARALRMQHLLQVAHYGHRRLSSMPKCPVHEDARSVGPAEK